MKFELDLKEELTRDQCKLYFKETWKNNLEKNNRSLLWLIPAGIFLIWSYQDHIPELSGFWIACLFMIVWAYIVYLIRYRRHKLSYYKTIEKMIARLKISGNMSTWEFLDDHFHYQDGSMDLKIAWGLLSKFSVIKENLVLETHEGIITCFILAKSEVGENEFQNIIDFTKEKIKGTQ